MVYFTEQLNSEHYNNLLLHILGKDVEVAAKIIGQSFKKNV